MGVTVWNTSGAMELNGVILDNGVIKLRGKAAGLSFDADHDTYFSAASDDILDLYIAGSKDFIFSSNKFNVETGSAITGTSAIAENNALFIPVAVQQAISGAGAITLLEYYTAVTTTGADSFTLIDGLVIGQMKKIQLIVDGGVATLTPTTLSGGTTITFADAGDYAILVWKAAGWVAIELNNMADGATAPVLA